MNPGIAIIAAVVLIGSMNAEEMRTLTVFKSDDSELYVFSDAITIAAGESAQLVGGTGLAEVEVSVNGLQFYQPPWNVDYIKAFVAGPATIRLREGGTNTAGRKSYATFSIHRVSSPTTPAAVPAEPGQNFTVVMESSSDLVSWTPAAPGTYAGTEPKRFFRVRIDRE
jgi:hypothetical protein